MTGAELRRARLRLDISQQDMAKAAKTTAPDLCRIERGQRDKTLAKWTNILKAYGFVIAPLDGPEAPDHWNEYTEQRP